MGGMAEAFTGGGGVGPAPVGGGGGGLGVAAPPPQPKAAGKGPKGILGTITGGIPAGLQAIGETAALPIEKLVTGKSWQALAQGAGGRIHRTAEAGSQIGNIIDVKPGIHQAQQLVGKVLGPQIPFSAAQGYQQGGITGAFTGAARGAMPGAPQVSAEEIGLPEPKNPLGHFAAELAYQTLASPGTYLGGAKTPQVEAAHAAAGEALGAERAAELARTGLRAATPEERAAIKAQLATRSEGMAKTEPILRKAERYGPVEGLHLKVPGLGARPAGTIERLANLPGLRQVDVAAEAARSAVAGSKASKAIQSAFIPRANLEPIVGKDRLAEVGQPFRDATSHVNASGRSTVETLTDAVRAVGRKVTPDDLVALRQAKESGRLVEYRGQNPDMAPLVDYLNAHISQWDQRLTALNPEIAGKLHDEGTYFPSELSAEGKKVLAERMNHDPTIARQLGYTDPQKLSQDLRSGLLMHARRVAGATLEDRNAQLQAITGHEGEFYETDPLKAFVRHEEAITRSEGAKMKLDALARMKDKDGNPLVSAEPEKIPGAVEIRTGNVLGEKLYARPEVADALSSNEQAMAPWVRNIMNLYKGQALAGTGIVGKHSLGVLYRQLLSEGIHPEDIVAQLGASRAAKAARAAALPTEAAASTARPENIPVPAAGGPAYEQGVLGPRGFETPPLPGIEGPPGPGGITEAIQPEAAGRPPGVPGQVGMRGAGLFGQGQGITPTLTPNANIGDIIARLRGQPRALEAVAGPEVNPLARLQAEAEINAPQGTAVQPQLTTPAGGRLHGFRATAQPAPEAEAIALGPGSVPGQGVQGEFDFSGRVLNDTGYDSLVERGLARLDQPGAAGLVREEVNGAPGLVLRDDGGKAIGRAWFEPGEAGPQTPHIDVLAEARGAGVATQIMNAALDQGLTTPAALRAAYKTDQGAAFVEGFLRQRALQPQPEQFADIIGRLQGQPRALGAGPVPNVLSEVAQQQTLPGVPIPMGPGPQAATPQISPESAQPPGILGVGAQGVDQALRLAAQQPGRAGGLARLALIERERGAQTGFAASLGIGENQPTFGVHTGGAGAVRRLGKAINPLKSESKLYTAPRAVTEKVERNIRGLNLAGSLRKGLTPQEAAARMANVLPEYSDLTPLMRKLRIAQPFAPYLMRNLAQQAWLARNNPARFVLQSNIANAARATAGPGQLQSPAEGGQIPIPGTSTYIRPNLPSEEALNDVSPFVRLLMGSGQAPASNTPQAVTQAVLPGAKTAQDLLALTGGPIAGIPKVLAEKATGKNLRFGSDLQTGIQEQPLIQETVPLVGKVNQLAEALGGDTQKALRFFAGAATTPTTNKTRYYDIRYQAENSPANQVHAQLIAERSKLYGQQPKGYRAQAAALSRAIKAIERDPRYIDTSKVRKQYLRARPVAEGGLAQPFNPTPYAGIGGRPAGMAAAFGGG